MFYHVKISHDIASSPLILFLGTSILLLFPIKGNISLLRTKVDFKVEIILLILFSIPNAFLLIYLILIDIFYNTSSLMHEVVNGLSYSCLTIKERTLTTFILA